jgi:hypothetical protein
MSLLLIERNKAPVLLTDRMLHAAFLDAIRRQAALQDAARSAAAANREWTDPDLKGISHAPRQA